MRPILTYALFKTLATKIEDLWIENDFYREKLTSLGISPPSLAQEVAAAQGNSQVRERAHQNFAEMWKLLDESADWFVAQDLGEQPPPNDRQN